MDLRSALRLLREHWELIFVVTILATSASAYATWRTTPQYAAEVTMFVSAWSSPEDTASAYQGSLLSQQKVKSYTELLRGHHVMSGVVDRLGLDVTPRQLAGKVSSSAIPDTSLLTATVQDPSPQRARQLADAIGAEFVEFVPSLESVAEGEPPAVKVTVVSPAETPAVPVSPQPTRNITVGLILGLLTGFGLAVARRTLDTTVKSSGQTEEISGAPTLGAVGLDVTAGKKPLIDPATRGPRVEAFRKIHANLQFLDVDRPHRAILVTSAVPNEGKSVTACNLAITLAEAGKRVIVIDADLRRPSIATYLGLPNGAGLTSVLLGTATVGESTQVWGGDLFTALTSGPIPPNPTTLLGSEQLRCLLADLRTAYDVVIVDSPPVLPVADAAVLAAACDGVAVVVRYGKTRREQLRGTVQALSNAGVPILGTVLNLAPPERSAYYDYRTEPGDETRHQETRVPAPPAHQRADRPDGAEPRGVRVRIR